MGAREPVKPRLTPERANDLAAWSFLVMLVLFCIGAISGPAVAFWLQLACLASFGFTVGCFFLALFIEGRGKRNRRAYLRKMCPKCHYPLVGLDKATTNEIICPECGAKWSVDLLLAGGGEMRCD